MKILKLLPLIFILILISGCEQEEKISKPNKLAIEKKPVAKKPIKADIINCTDDVKQCPDGSYVSRDTTNNCKFKNCPTSESALY